MVDFQDFEKQEWSVPVWCWKRGDYREPVMRPSGLGHTIDDAGYYSGSMPWQVLLQMVSTLQQVQLGSHNAEHEVDISDAGHYTAPGIIMAVAISADHIPDAAKFVAASDPLFAKIGRVTFADADGYCEPVHWVNYQKSLIRPSLFPMRTIGWGFVPGTVGKIKIRYIPVNSYTSADLQSKYSLEDDYSFFDVDNDGGIANFQWWWTDPDNFPPRE